MTSPILAIGGGGFLMEDAPSPIDRFIAQFVGGGGNTGRANVSAMRPMPIPDDLRRLLEDHGA